MRKDLPPVKNKPSGKQVSGAVKLYDGKPSAIYMDDRKAGEYHFIVPSTEFYMTKDELLECINILEAQS